MVNRVTLIGRLTADPEVRTTATGTQMANLRLATNEYGGKDDSGARREHTEFHNLVLFGRQAEVAASYLRKGRMLYADGRLPYIGALPPERCLEPEALFEQLEPRGCTFELQVHQATQSKAI